MQSTIVLALAAASFLAACGSAGPEDFPKEAKPAVPSLYDLSAKSLEGADVDLADYRGRAVLVVNVASECGFTPQYAGLEKLHEEFTPRGFAVLGFPSNEFGGQEPGSAEQIRAFCTSKFSVTFPMFEKVEVKKGAGQSPVYAYLTTVTGREPAWNFCKYVVDREGHVTHYFASTTKPDSGDLRAAIESALGPASK